MYAPVLFVDNKYRCQQQQRNTLYHRLQRSVCVDVENQTQVGIY